MKHVSLLLLLLSLFRSALAQKAATDTSYYNAPVRQKSGLTVDPDDNPAHRQSRAGKFRRRQPANAPLIEQLRETQAWYACVEGGFRSNVSTLSNSFNGLVSSPTQTKAVWSILVGYTYRRAWTVETGYAQAPVHLNVTLANYPEPFVFNYQNGGSGIPLRLKRRLGSAKRATNTTGFWLSAAGWLIPNGSQPAESLVFTGYGNRGRSNRVDSIRLNVTTGTASRLSGLAEVGLDYTARLASFLELGIYVRKYWGLGNTLQSDLVYKVNSATGQPASITANGSGWGFGLALHYVYGRRYELKKTDVSVP